MPLDVTTIYRPLNAPTVGDLMFWTVPYLQDVAARMLTEQGRTGAHEVVRSAIDGRTVATIAIIGDGRQLRIIRQRDLDALEGAGDGVVKYAAVHGSAYAFSPTTPAVVQAFQVVTPEAASPLPQICFDLAHIATLAESRGAETDGAMPEVAQHLRMIVSTALAVLQENWT